jgi:hypothetical protein
MANCKETFSNRFVFCKLSALSKTSGAVCGLNNTGKKMGNQAVNRFSDDTKMAEAFFNLCLKSRQLNMPFS